MDTTEDYVDTNWSWHVQKIPFVPIRLARPRILHGPEHVILHRNGTNDHEQPRSVSLVPKLPGGGLRHTLTSGLEMRLFGLKKDEAVFFFQMFCLTKNLYLNQALSFANNIPGINVCKKT